MAITTLAGIRTGTVQPTRYMKNAAFNTLAAHRHQSSFYLSGGDPAAATAPAPGLAGAALTSYAGQILVPSASNTTYLSNFSAYDGPSGTARGQMLLCDRLWHNSGINITLNTAQTINSVAWPARDINNSTNGDGVFIGVEVRVATGAGTPTLTLSYTNQAGTAGRTGTNIIATVASAGIGSFYVLGLQAGDTGVRSIQTYTQSATWTSGTIHLVAFRIMAVVPLRGAGIPGNDHDYTHLGLNAQPDNTVPFLLFQGAGGPPRTQCEFGWAQG
jgi:hypothetical protein